MGLAAFVGCSTPVADVGGVSEGLSSSAGPETGSTDTGQPPTEGGTGAGAGVDSSTGDSATGSGLPVLDVGGNTTPPDGCASSAASFMYLLSSEPEGGTPSSDLYRLRPSDLELELIAALDCEGAHSAMALTIDRTGMLWAMTVDDDGYRKIHTIDPVTGACSPTDFDDPIEELVFVNTLAFVADEPGGETESLYLGANLGASFDPNIPLSLERVELTTMDIDLVGTADLAPNGGYQIADLSGTGDSRLFGFFAGNPAVIVEFNNDDGSFIEVNPLDFGVGSPWAFAQWAGRLWLFSSAGDPGSDIRAWDPVSKTVETLHPGIGVAVVGAAVSTCAPFQPEG